MLSQNLIENIKAYQKVFSKNISIVFREIESINGQLKCCIIYSEAMIIQELLSESIIQPIQKLKGVKKNNNISIVDYIANQVLSVNDIKKVYKIEETTKGIMQGDTVLLIDGCPEVLLINSRSWETRAISEPTSERITKGSQEGFTEAAITNITLIKRKLLDTNLKFEEVTIGEVSNTSIYITYLQNIVSDELINEVKKRLNNVNIEAILDSNYIVESINSSTYSHFSTVGTSQRPDIIAAKLLEGKVAIICDGSPEVLFVPFLFYEHFIVNEDYYYNYMYAIFNRIVRITSFFLTSSISAIYLAMVTYHQHMLPQEIFKSIAVAREGVPFPTIIELMLMLFTFEILREAGTRLPLNFGQAVSIVGALVLGEAAVSARFVSAPIVIVAAISGITGLMLPKLMEAMIVIRVGLLLLSAFYGLYGYIFGVMGIVAYLMSVDSFGTCYMEFVNNPGKMNLLDTVVRVPWKKHRGMEKNIIKKHESLNKNNK